MLQLFKRMKRREALMALGVAVLILGQVWVDLLLPDYMSGLTVLIETQGAMRDIWLTGLSMLGCVLASTALSIASGYLAARMGAGFTFALRSDVFHRVMDLGPAEMNALSVPSLITRTTNDITAVQMMLSMGLQIIVRVPIMAVWAIIKILGKSWELSVVTAGFVAVICITMLTISRIVVPRFRKVQKLTDRINGIARENLSGISVVHAFNAEDYQNKKFDASNLEMMNIQLKNQRLFAVMGPIISMCMGGLSITIYWLGAALLNRADAAARLTLFSNIVVFSTYAVYVVMSFMLLLVIFMLWPAAKVSAERINEVLHTEPAIREGTRSDAPEVGTIEFKNVSFRYPNGGDDCLRDLSFRVEKGETLAVIGATGCGKTTLVSLMARLYEATEGEIRLDGVPIRDFSFAALYDRLGFVTQKAVLFSDSIRENVLFGEKTGGLGDAERAVSIAQAADFVATLEEGMDYRIAQSGKNISGGQKQRFAIARALAREPEILIFDDSFSALDYKTDAALRGTLERELGDTTCVIVAQRISTIRRAEKILVLEDGRAVGLGNHEELMRDCAVYREIALSQLSEEELQ